MTSSGSSKKIITVFGATGTQGGSVVNYILSDSVLSNEYHIRGVTRDPSKPAAQALKKRGVEPVQADINDAESLKTALAGSHAVFLVTDFWEKMSAAIEVQQGKNVLDASKAAGVKHLIWSGLMNATKMSGGQLKHVTHFDSKADISDYIEQHKGSSLVTTHVMPGFYLSNLKTMISKQPGADAPALALPMHPTDTHIPFIDIASDYGKYVGGVLRQDPAAVNGKKFQAVTQWTSPQGVVETFTKATGIETRFAQIDPDTYRSFLPDPIKDELTENMLLVRDFSYYGTGSEKQQAESDKILAPGVKTISLEEAIKGMGPWEF